MIQNKIFWLFLLLVLVQWAIPGHMILEQENILNNGKTYNFKTRPIDPVDPFRGRYIVLSFEAENFETTEVKEWQNEKKKHSVYAILGKDSLGFVKVKNVLKEEPEGDRDYLKIDDWNFWHNTHTGIATINLDFPFKRFYMEEYKAPVAEQTYMDAQIDSSQVSWAIVKILNGNAVLEDVLIDGKSVNDIVEQGKE